MKYVYFGLVSDMREYQQENPEHDVIHARKENLLGLREKVLPVISPRLGERWPEEYQVCMAYMGYINATTPEEATQ